ncbi:MAG TPA: type II toxin-antitoxin system ParD family antitoxin [Tepidisphaeraceae bacterium]|nr:type II toxin-antitoxin system ParD family antitoxin [Tepidisphaeraceae bacterium]
MKLELSSEVERQIADRLQSGRYASASDVIEAALRSLEQHEQRGDFAPGEWDRLLAEAEASGEPVDAATVFADLRDPNRRNRT